MDNQEKAGLQSERIPSNIYRHSTQTKGVLLIYFGIRDLILHSFSQQTLTIIAGIGDTEMSKI